MSRRKKEPKQKMFRGKKYTYNGETLTLHELCIKYNANYPTARTRIGRGESIENALRNDFYLPKHSGHCVSIIYNGKEMSLYEAAMRAGLEYPTVMARYKKGERDIEKLLRFPKHRGKYIRYGHSEW